MIPFLFRFVLPKWESGKLTIENIETYGAAFGAKIVGHKWNILGEAGLS